MWHLFAWTEFYWFSARSEISIPELRVKPTQRAAFWIVLKGLDPQFRKMRFSNRSLIKPWGQQAHAWSSDPNVPGGWSLKCWRTTLWVSDEIIRENCENSRFRNWEKMAKSGNLPKCHTLNSGWTSLFFRPGHFEIFGKNFEKLGCVKTCDFIVIL